MLYSLEMEVWMCIRKCCCEMEIDIVHILECWMINNKKVNKWPHVSESMPEQTDLRNRLYEYDRILMLQA